MAVWYDTQHQLAYESTTQAQGGSIWAQILIPTLLRDKKEGLHIEWILDFFFWVRLGQKLHQMCKKKKKGMHTGFELIVKLVYTHFQLIFASSSVSPIDTPQFWCRRFWAEKDSEADVIQKMELTRTSALVSLGAMSWECSKRVNVLLVVTWKRLKLFLYPTAPQPTWICGSFAEISWFVIIYILRGSFRATGKKFEKAKEKKNIYEKKKTST